MPTSAKPTPPKQGRAAIHPYSYEDWIVAREGGGRARAGHRSLPGRASESAGPLAARRLARRRPSIQGPELGRVIHRSRGEQPSARAEGDGEDPVRVPRQGAQLVPGGNAPQFDFVIAGP